MFYPFDCLSALEALCGKQDFLFYFKTHKVFEMFSLFCLRIRVFLCYQNRIKTAQKNKIILNR